MGNSSLKKASSGFSLIKTELVTNGTFVSTVDNWTANLCTLAVNSGWMEMTRVSGSWQYAWQNITLEVGKYYTFQANVKSGTSGNELSYLLIGESNCGAQVSGTGYGWVYSTVASQTMKTTWLATQANISIQVIKASSTAGTMLFDAISIKEFAITAPGDIVATGQIASGMAPYLDHGLSIFGSGYINGLTIKSGYISSTIMPAFLARLSATQSNVTGDGTSYMIPVNSEVFDQASNFDGAGTFTAPITGKYQFSGAVRFGDIAAGHTWLLYLVTSNRNYLFSEGAYTKSMVTLNFSILADMDAADVAQLFIIVSGGTKIIEVQGHATETDTHFAGRLVC